MSILTLDLGTKCGYALQTGRGERLSGTWILSEPSSIKAAGEADLDRTREPRFFELANRIEKIVQLNEDLRLIAFEDVLFSKYTKQTQLWSSLRAAIWAVVWKHPHIRVDCLNTTSLKVFGANHGGATKEMMAAWLMKRHPETFCRKGGKTLKQTGIPLVASIVDDNEIDALHLLDWAVATFPDCR